MDTIAECLQLFGIVSFCFFANRNIVPNREHYFVTIWLMGNDIVSNSVQQCMKRKLARFPSLFALWNSKRFGDRKKLTYRVTDINC